jgi:glucose/arabinose dehydrogenase
MHRTPTPALFLIAAILPLAAALAFAPPVRAAEPGELRVQRTVILANLENPWDLAVAPDGALFFTEKCRGLSVRTPDGTVRHLFGTSGAAVVADDLFCQGQSGMLGLALDPAFADNRRLYLFMASKLGGQPTNRVVRLQVNAANTTVSGRTDIVADIPFKASFTRWGRAGAHSGGRLRFSSKDGFLYVTTGDNHNGPLPQDLTRLGGKVLRIDQDGRPAPGNTTPNGVDARIFTYGHRNVQGLAFRPVTGQPFACEHGPGHSDEVTPLVAGGNGGWDPAPTRGVSCASDYCGYTSNKPDGSRTSMTDRERFPAALPPSWTNQGVSEGMGPCVFLDGPDWGDWAGRLAVGFLREARIDLLQLDAGGQTTGVRTITGLPAERMRSLVVAPDGALLVATDGGEIWRLERADR